MSKKIGLILISIILIFSFALPLITFAQDVNWPLEQNEVENLLDIIRKEPLTGANFDLFFESIEGYKPDSPRKTGAVVLVKQTILKEQFDYWFKQVPKELSIKFIKTAFKIIPLIYSQDISGVINFIEKLSVQKATDYAIEWLLQNEIKIGSGELSYLFYSYKGNWQEIKIQYIIVYHSLNQNQGKIVVEFYSKNPIEPPIGTRPNGLGGNQDDLRSNPWPWDYWLENERKRNDDGKLEPFILRIKGYITKNRWGKFEWDDNKSKPTVKIDFDDPVPEIENSDFILENPPSKISFAGEVIGLFWEKLKSKTSDVTTNFLDIIRGYFSSSRPEAQIAEQIIAEQIEEEVNIPSEPTSEPTEEEISEVKEILEEILEQGVSEETPPTLEELKERLDKLSEEVDVFIARIQQLLAEKALNQPEEELQEEEELKEEIVICSLSDAQYPTTNKVIFNEVAWMGTKNSSSDEWIELKNISGATIDLNGWQILDKDIIEGKTKGIEIIFGKASINPGGFFLLERTDDTSVPNIPADLIYTGSLNNTNKVLYLFDKNCILQDKVEANPDWPAGSNSSKRTMERNPTNLDWQTSSNPSGTPRTKNSSGYYESSTETNGSGDSTDESSPPTPDTTTTTDTIYFLLDVVINEIAWMGTASSSNDEWIEFYNNTTRNINLQGWGLYEQEGEVLIGPLTGTIMAKSYYLIERTAETTISDIEASQSPTGWGGYGLNNNGEYLRLLDNNSNIIDEVGCQENWFAGNNDSKHTMERINPRVSGNNPENWADNNGKTRNGLDAGGNLIYGTPKAKNSVFSTSPPNPVPNFSIDEKNSKYNTVVLTWSTTTDPDTPDQDISYIIYWTKEEISEGNASATNPTAFSTSTATTTFILSTLNYNSTYYFGIRAFDGGNYSSLSTTTSYNTSLPPINDLNAGTSAIRKAVDLFWTAPGAEKYLIKYAEKEIVENPIDESQITWENASSVQNLIIPKTYGEIENFTVENLIPDKIYYFAIKTINTANATSEISNSPKNKVIPGFIDNGNGTVTDLYTGLMWIKDGEGSGSNNGEPMVWQEAKDFSNNLVLCKNGIFISTSSTSTSFCAEYDGIKYDDWRLPNFKELSSIINYSKNSPAIDENYFINTISAKYWTSSYRYYPGIAYVSPASWDIEIVDFNNGSIVITSDKNALHYIRLVRGPDSGMPNILSPTGLEGDPPGTCNLGYTENDDGTVVDSCTGLVWIKDGTRVLIGSESNYPLSPRPKTISWKNAINLCNNLTTAGYNDWRLPNIREIINVSNKNGSVILPWESGYSGYYWSSTSDGSNAWGTGNGYNAGRVQILSKAGSVYIQCLRSNIGS